MAKKNAWDYIGDAVPIVGPIISGLFGGNNAEEQRQEQKELTADQVEAAKELAQHQSVLAKDMWDYTNIANQKEHYKDAGMNPALMYGGSGGTGTSAGISTPMPTGGQAANTEARRANELNMGMQIAQMGLIAAQTEKTEAEAQQIAGVQTDKGRQDIKESQTRVTAQEFQNEINKAFGWQLKQAETTKEEISAEKENLNWEMYKAVAWGSGNVTEENNTAYKALKAQFDKNVTDLQNAKKDGRIKDAEAIITEFGAKMANEGLAPNSPWYVKMIDTMLNKAGIHISDTPKYIK